MRYTYFASLQYSIYSLTVVMSYLLFVNLLKPTKYLHIVKHPYHSFLFAVAFIVFMYCVVKAIQKHLDIFTV